MKFFYKKNVSVLKLKKKTFHIYLELKRMFPNNLEDIDRYYELAEKVEASLGSLVLLKLTPKFLQPFVYKTYLQFFVKYAGRSAYDCLKEITTNKHLASLLGK